MAKNGKNECNIIDCKAMCCQNISVLSEKEILRIKNYIKKNNIQPVNRNNILTQENANKCPFLNEEYKCNIYPVRPEICRWFHCSNYKKNELYLDPTNKLATDMMATFFPECYNPNPPDLTAINENYQEKRKIIIKNRLMKK